MLTRKLVVVICAVAVVVIGCSDSAPNLLSKGEDWLVTFKRVTVPSDSPGLAEIEIEVRTGVHFSQPAPDGTKVTVTTSLGRFSGHGSAISTPTIGGRVLVTLEIPDSGAITLTARVLDTENGLALLVRTDGTLSCSSHQDS